MMQSISQRLLVQAARWVEHPNWVLRRTSQLTVLGSLGMRVVVHGLGHPLDKEREKQEQFIESFATSPSLREYVQARRPLQHRVGLLARTLLMLQAADARLRELARSPHPLFALRIEGRVDQRVLRNLLIWHNHAIGSPVADRDEQSIDVALVLASACGDESRLFELISASFMLERVRNISVFWGEESVDAAVPTLTGNAAADAQRAPREAWDLGRMPVDLVDHVTRRGTAGGIKVVQDARKRTQDFFKTALPRQVVIAVSLKEGGDGTIDAAELNWLLRVLDGVVDRYSRLGFVILNRLAPSRWQRWPVHIRFARHQGFSLQDAISIAQFADGYLGVLDMFGLTANAAARPGVYFPLDEGELLGAEGSPAIVKDRQVMLASCDRARIETAITSFLEDLGRL
jgi:hypothetical protein